ncbi:MAG: IS110 family transposase [Chloroflexi bacterium CG23_combo_of_CG06-09_8_20_14_all_45_10]|nr:MAG: IS110 family transposase [Chloroflexi bacterium CG23_combo_of_CG06-09_8_20_14_all_45_10]
MEDNLERCCGIDVHKSKVVACLLVGELNGEVKKTIKTFSTMTNDLLKLRDWLEAEGCTHVAVESTGVYWKPVFNILESSVKVILANARHIKNLPGRKTDVKDCEWIAKLLRCGLIEESFIPPKPIRELRDLTRYRKKLVSAATAERNRVQKILEDANIKFSSVASNVFGASGREILQALTQGEQSPEEMAQLAKGKLRGKIPELVESLNGCLSDHHRYLLEKSLRHLEFLEEPIEELEQRIDACLEPYGEECELLQTIPGVKEQTAASLIAEIGTDMSRFPTDAHLSSWAGMSPGNNESAGKRKSGRTTKGDSSLRCTLCEAAWGASRTKNTYLSARYHRIAARRGKKRAIMALGHKILVIVYHVLKQGRSYLDLGSDYFDKLHRKALETSLVKKLQSLGYCVSLEPILVAA